MGNYLNSSIPYKAFSKEYNSPYFVDKSMMLKELTMRIQTSTNYICITRPRRFGKSVMANMIASFFTPTVNDDTIFKKLAVGKTDIYDHYYGQYDVIFISFNEMPKRCDNYEQYIERIENKLIHDLKTTYPQAQINENDACWDAFTAVFNSYHEKQFIFIFDEWDFIFHQDFISEQDKRKYIRFLSNLLKDKVYSALTYMTGILPIAKYSSGSELNMFAEYTMVSEEMYSEYFGFTETEVDSLYKKYLSNQMEPQVTREGLRLWYNGYHTKSGERMYNPRSVVMALTNNNLGNYWTSSGPYDEIYYYVNHNIAAVREDLAQMIAGIPVLAKIQEYAAVSMNLTTRNEILSAMVVYGFLSYEKGYVSIPNKELMDRFNEMLIKEPTLGYVHQLAAKSSDMLKATLAGDSSKVAKIMQLAHDTETPLLSYNSESELTVLVTLVYLSARDFYRIEREDKAGIGYVDFIFYPEIDHHADAIIIELKVDHTAEDALQQIKERKYALKLEGHLGEAPKYTGRILGVGIAYDKKTKEHTCKIEILRKQLF
ncbi:MAG: AAA family ATPase [Lachnospiraceae bacterium]|nr:AAA family ATPase [Lachnospiraceae bacterium]